MLYSIFQKRSGPQIGAVFVRYKFLIKRDVGGDCGIYTTAPLNGFRQQPATRYYMPLIHSGYATLPICFDGGVAIVRWQSEKPFQKHNDGKFALIPFGLVYLCGCVYYNMTVCAAQVRILGLPLSFIVLGKGVDYTENELLAFTMHHPHLNTNERRA